MYNCYKQGTAWLLFFSTLLASCRTPYPDIIHTPEPMLQVVADTSITHNPSHESFEQASELLPSLTLRAANGQHVRFHYHSKASMWVAQVEDDRLEETKQARELPILFERGLNLPYLWQTQPMGQKKLLHIIPSDQQPNEPGYIYIGKNPSQARPPQCSVQPAFSKKKRKAWTKSIQEEQAINLTEYKQKKTKKSDWQRTIQKKARVTASQQESNNKHSNELPTSITPLQHRTSKQPEIRLTAPSTTPDNIGLIYPPIIVQSGHQIYFQQLPAGQWQALVQDNLPPFISSNLVLPVYLVSAEDIANIHQHTPAWHNQHIRVIWGKQDSYVLVGKLALQGRQ